MLQNMNKLLTHQCRHKLVTTKLSSAGAVEYTDCISADGLALPPTSVLHRTLKKSDGGASVMLELWGMRSNLSLPSLPGPLWPRVVGSDRVLSLGQIELFDQCYQV